MSSHNGDDVEDAASVSDVDEGAARAPSDHESHDEPDDKTLHVDNATNGTTAAATAAATATAAAEAEVDADKWCALCEKDGHLAYDCPEEL